jgi:hypothetical protein
MVNVNQDMAMECLNEMMFHHNQAMALALANMPLEANEALNQLDYALFRMHAIIGMPSPGVKVIYGKRASDN